MNFLLFFRRLNPFDLIFLGFIISTVPFVNIFIPAKFYIVPLFIFVLFHLITTKFYFTIHLSFFFLFAFYNNFPDIDIIFFCW